MTTRLHLVFLTLLVTSTLLVHPLPLSRSANSRRSDSSDSSSDSSALTRSSETSRSMSKSEESTAEGMFEGDIKLRKGQNPYRESLSYSSELRPVEKRDIVETGSGSGAGEEIPVSTRTEPEDYKNRMDLWDGGKVPYKFDSNLPTLYRMRFEEAMRWWTNATDGCITFVHGIKNASEDHLLFRQDKKGCSSYLGRKGGEQWLNISASCDEVGNAVHEIGHALGMWHEHSRRDRDNYITINWGNILEDGKKNFEKIMSSEYSKVPPISYDIESIMHYGPRAFANNQDRTKPSIEPKNGTVWDMCDNPANMGQRDYISHKDVLRVKLLYGCGDVTPTDMPTGCNRTLPTAATRPTPEPTKTMPPMPRPTPTRTRLRSNDRITLRFNFANGQEGMRCVPTNSPGCTPTPCHTTSIFGDNSSHCTNIENIFTIFKIDGTEKIRSGDTIALRSANKPDRWLDCSLGRNKRCTISKCTSNNNLDNIGARSNISDCEQHFFKINGVNRGTGKVLSTSHKIQLVSESAEAEKSIVSCEDGKRCKLLSETECRANSERCNVNVTFAP